MDSLFRNEVGKLDVFCLVRMDDRFTKKRFAETKSGKKEIVTKYNEGFTITVFGQRS